jgi:hypothetical protein
VRRSRHDHGVDACRQGVIERRDQARARGEHAGIGEALPIGIGDGDDLRARALDEHAEEVSAPRSSAGERYPKGQRSPFGAAPLWGALGSGLLAEPVGRGASSSRSTASLAGLPGWIEGPLMSTTKS